MSKIDESNKKNKIVIKMLLKDMKKYYIWMIINIIMVLLFSCVNICFAKILGSISDTVLLNKPELLYRYFGIGLALSVTNMFIKFLRVFCLGKFSEGIAYDIRKKYIEHINRIKFKDLDNSSKAELLSRMVSDLDKVKVFLQSNLSDLLSIPLIMISYSVELFKISWKLALFEYIAIPFLMLLLLYISKGMNPYLKDEQRKAAKANLVAKECVNGLIIVKSFSIENQLYNKYRSYIKQGVKSGLKAVKIQSVIIPFATLMQYLPFIFTLVYGGYLEVNNEMEFGQLLTFMQIMIYSLKNITSIPKVVSSMQNALTSYGRIYDVLEKDNERTDGEIYKVDDCVDVISFENITFSYNKDENVLNNLNLSIKKGETVAIVGNSGSGKSSLLKLITGFYEPNKGKIKIFNHEINDWNLDELRNYMAIVPQNPYLFPENIYTNVEYGKIGASEKEIFSAIKYSNIDSSVLDINKDSSEIVGENSVKISGGEKQRIAIARAFLKDASILLLDEVTSALDAKLQKEIERTIEVLSKDRTTIMIAHRLSTIKHADRIIVMNNGQIVEEGTYEELLSNDGFFKNINLKDSIIDKEEVNV